MSGRDNRGRNAIALTASAILHAAFLMLVINQSVSPYQLPTPASPPFEVEIVPEQELPQPPPPPPPVIPPKIRQALEKQNQPPPPPLPPQPTPPKPQVQPPTPAAPKTPTPPKPSPPTPAPIAPPAPVPARLAPPRPNPAPAAPAPAKTPAPARPSPNPSPSPSPSPHPAPAPLVAPPNPSTAKVAAPVVVNRLSRLNIHKSTRITPAGVPTLPMAPSEQKGGGAPGGGAPGGGSAGALAGSRLNGLSPWPYGAMPSGGSGLRGTLVGCANAEAVGLSSVERARCAERFGAEASRAPALDGIAPDKRAAFDKTAGKQDAARRAGNSMPVGTSAGVDGFGGLGPP